MLLTTILAASLLASPALPAGVPDTARIIPTQELPVVTVRPGQPVKISSMTGKRKDPELYGLIAQIKVAVHLPATTRGLITQLQLETAKRPVSAGSLRIRLLAAPTEELSDIPAGPNLLGNELELSAQQLTRHSTKGILSIDLSQYQVTMPEHGVIVVIESVGPAHAPNYLALTPASKHRGSPMVVTNGPEGSEVTRLNQWPTLNGACTSGAGRTWVMGSQETTWRPRRRTKEGLIFNCGVSVVVLSNEAQARK